jgi:hypothetical protein
MKKTLAIALILCLALPACAPAGNDAEIAALQEQIDQIQPKSDSDEKENSTTEESMDFTNPTMVDGLPSVNVRLFYVDDGIILQHHPDMLFNLSQIEHYHEFIYKEDLARIVFTAEAAIRDFRFLDIVWNDNFSWEEADGDERFYSVRSVLYSLDELTPEVPFVVTGVDMGCALAAHGFSFVDENGITRYFAFLQSGKDDEGIFISEF